MNGPGKWRWIVPAAVLVALVLSGSSLAAPVGQISEFATATASAVPEGIVAGPDGNLWYAEDWQQDRGDQPLDGRRRRLPGPTANELPARGSAGS